MADLRGWAAAARVAWLGGYAQGKGVPVDCLGDKETRVMELVGALIGAVMFALLCVAAWSLVWRFL